MAVDSKIEWTEATWNPVTGCSKISPGCKFCYAERMAKRLKAMGRYSYRNEFKVTLQPQMLDFPSRVKAGKMIFVNSMSDLFHKNVPDEYILKVFDIMGENDHHVYQVLTKRSDRLRNISHALPWEKHIWMGVSVESQDYVCRIEDLKKSSAKIKFLSIEPLISKIGALDLDGIDWVIVGGESGPGARPMDPQWVRDIRDICLESNVPFFFKQWGGINKKKTGRMIDGRTWDEVPFRPGDLIEPQDSLF